MPPHIRAMLTAVVVLVTVFAWIFRETIYLDASPFLVFGLALFMVVALWLFPEVKKGHGKQ